MTANIDEYGNLTSYQGDTVLFNCDGIPTDLPYIVYMSIMELDSDTDVVEQLSFVPTGDTVQICVPPDITKLITVPSGKKFKDYRYALKACNAANNIEHTLLIGDTSVGSEYKYRQYRRQSEGTENT